MRHFILWAILVWSLAAPGGEKRYPYVERDQRQWGTCHAFGILPAIDYLENAERPSSAPLYRVSEMWSVMVSILDRVCNPGPDNSLDHRARADREIDQGARAGANLNRLLALGYCERESYLDYDLKDTRDAHKLERSLNTKSAANIAPSPGDRSRFEAIFGVSLDDLMPLCSSDPDESVDRLLARYRRLETNFENSPSSGPGAPRWLERHRAFRRCLAQSRKKRHELKTWGCEIDETVMQPWKPGADPLKTRYLQSLLDDDRGKPVIVTMANYPSGRRRKPNRDEFHVVSIVGHGGRQPTAGFSTHNSWGAGHDHAIPYTATGNIASAVTLECPRKPAVAGTDPGRPHASTPDARDASSDRTH